MAADKYFQTVVLSKLKEGEIPWHRPWKPGYSGAISRATGKPYGVINQWLLQHTGEYIGIGAAKALGVDFRGVRTEKVTWCTHKSEPVIDQETGLQKTDPKTGELLFRDIFYDGVHPVLPVCLCKGIEPKARPDNALNPDSVKVRGLENVVNGYLSKAEVSVTETDGLFGPEYDCGERRINIPKVGRYESTEAYYNDLFRMLVRSACENADERGPRSDARNELTAEMGASMLCSTFCLDTKAVFDNSMAYIQKWSKAIAADERMLLSSARRAESAVNAILGIRKDKEQEKS